MNKNIAIKVEGLSKKYQTGEKQLYMTLRDQLSTLPKRLFKKQKNKEFWALKNINFEIKKGEVVGIIGRNGAGKSTLLKILSRIVEPTNGKITMRGKVSSLLEVGTGFNQELTGSENIYLNGAIIGMKKKEINIKFNEIVRFSGIGKFLDTPVKHYSSGMYVRLAFSVAAHLESDILLVDEVLAVGDIEFRKKSLGKMKNMASSGRTVVFVSHNMEAIMSLCEKSIYLKNGKIAFAGTTAKVIKAYE
jgi:lipopolysaccharide transport system ATP-binding protein